jgi:hypothetical protein
MKSEVPGERAARLPEGIAQDEIAVVHLVDRVRRRPELRDVGRHLEVREVRGGWTSDKFRSRTPER